MPINLDFFNEETSSESKCILEAIDRITMISISNAKTEITYANDLFCKISKYNQEELIGKEYKILKSGHHPERFYNEFYKALIEKHLWSGEIKNKAKDGSFYWVFTTVAPMLNSDGEVVKYISIGFDISEKKLLEEKMSKLKIDLDQVMIEREIREQFLSTLSHDLKTPLTIAKISAQIIGKKEFISEKVKKLTGKINDNITRVDDMITLLLNINRNRNQQKHSLEITEFDMGDVALETIENMATIHGDHFKLRMSGDLRGHWCCLGIRRILENFISNAIKYGDADKYITIKITGDIKQLKLSVHNFGRLISTNDQQIIFDYLERTSSKDSGKKGWGLGLTAVKGITEALGGNIQVSSDADSGTTFAVTLPKNSKIFIQERGSLSAHAIIENESDNFIRLFKHMPEIVLVMSGKEHTVEFVNEAFVDTFEVLDSQLLILPYLKFLDEVYRMGIPQKLMRAPLTIANKTHYFNHTWVPRKNNSGKIIGVMSISSEVN